MTPKVAFFTDCFHEVNGVALTSQKFAQFSRSTGRPFLTVHRGDATGLERDGEQWDLALEDSRASVGLERDLSFDLRVRRHLPMACQITANFGADLIHVTSPGHIGLLGAFVAERTGLPLVASWHTNVHEFGARRLSRQLAVLPQGARSHVTNFAEQAVLALVLRFYRRAALLFAPNPELVAMLEQRTGTPCYLMERGIDINTFAPRHRTRSGGPFVIGFVGRLSAEKNVRLLVDLDHALRTHGLHQHRFLIVGDGSERQWLQRHLPSGDFTGVLRGAALAQAYANMDVFVFPSETDTYGNVIQEALASGVPCVVSARGGPKYLVRPGETGYIAATLEEYEIAVAALINDPGFLARMRDNARRAAEGRSWAAVFEGVYARYCEHLTPQTKHTEIVSSNLLETDNLR